MSCCIWLPHRATVKVRSLAVLQWGRCCAALLCLAVALQASAEQKRHAAPLVLAEEASSWVTQHRSITVGYHDTAAAPVDVPARHVGGSLGQELLQAAAGHLGMEVRMRRFISADAALEAACRGEVDVVVDASARSGMARCVVFSAAYLSTPIALVGRAHDARLADTRLQGLTLVLGRNAVELSEVRTRYPGADVVVLQDAESALRDVSEGRADAFVGNAQVARSIIAEKELSALSMIRPMDLTEDQRSFAVPVSRRPLLSALEAAIDHVTVEERAGIDARWVAVLDWSPGARLPLGARERMALSSRLRLGVAPDASPLSAVDEHGQPYGLAVSYLQQLRSAGARFDIAGARDVADVRNNMERGELDVVIGLPLSAMPDDGSWVYSRPFVTVPNVVVTRVGGDVRALGLADLQQRRVVVSASTWLLEQVSARAAGAQVIQHPDAIEALGQVAAGEMDAFVGNLAVVAELVRHHYPGVLQISAPAGIDDQLVLGVRRMHAPLLVTFNRILERMGTAQDAQMRNQWLTLKHYSNGMQWSDVVRWALPILVVVMVAFGVLGLAYVRIRKEVARRMRAETRLSQVSRYLPAVVYQLRRGHDGAWSFPFIIGDVGSLFALPGCPAPFSVEMLLAKVHPDDKALVTAALAGTDEIMGGIDIEFRLVDGKGWRWIRSRATGIPAEDGASLWNGYWIDITRKREQADALAAALAARSEFLATMSHEIRAPMAGILGMLELMSSESLQPQQRRILDVIDESAQMLRQLLDDILDLSRLEAGAFHLEPQPIDLRALVCNVVHVLHQGAADKGLLLEVEIDGDVVERHLVDGVRLRQVLFNLVSNAIKFTANGRVSVALAIDQVQGDDSMHEIRLRVTDTGIGISDDQQATLFQPFSQADSSISRRYGGTGLGLSICRRLVQQMHGEISLQSVVGMGTQVDVLLHLAAVPAAPSEEVECTVSSGEALEPSGACVLVAEDQVVNRMLMRWRMEQLGVRCDIVEDGRQALRALQAGNYDLLITDCRMPDMDGYALAAAVRAQEDATGRRRLPIIAMTASGMPEQVARCIKVGMDEVLVKPATRDQLRDALQRWLPARGSGGAETTSA